MKAYQNKRASYFLIKNPCSKYDFSGTENFNDQFCKSCNKNVRNLSREKPQLSEYVGQCVKVYPSQLSHSNNSRKTNKISKSLTVSSFILLLFSSCNSKLIQSYDDNWSRVYINKKESKLIKKGSRIIKGNVKESYSEEVIIYATISVKGTDVFTNTDFDGNFMLELDDPIDSNAILQIAYMGYLTVEIEVSKIVDKNITVEIDEGPLIGYLEISNDQYYTSKLDTNSNTNL